LISINLISFHFSGVLTDDFNFLAALLIQEVSGLAESLPRVCHIKNIRERTLVSPVN